MQWKIKYTLANPIPIQGTPQQYPTVNISLDIDANNILQSITHTLSNGPEDQNAAIHTSTLSLCFFFDILEFFYGLPINIAAIRVQKVPSTGNAETNVAIVHMDVAICRQVTLPDQEKLKKLKEAAWQIRFFNEARRSTSDAEAVRLYYMILESISMANNRKSGIANSNNSNFSDIDKIKYTRDFISHGQQLNNPRAICFIKKEICEEISEYDPRNPSHANFIRRMRQFATDFINQKLSEI